MEIFGCLIILTRYLFTKSQQTNPWVVGDLISLRQIFFTTWLILFNFQLQIDIWFLPITKGLAGSF